MVKKYISVFLFIVFTSSLYGQSHINFRGAPIYIHGINIPWNHFGWDIGTHPTKGVGYDPLWFEEAFSKFEASGINTARFWIHTDGRASPEFNGAGFVTGLDSNFFEHLDDLVSRAEAHNIYLIFCLWSFGLVQDRRNCCGRYAGNHADLIQEEEKTQSYIDHVLVPMVKRYNGNCSVLAWEVMNEPEWAIEGIGHKSELVAQKDMQRFIAMQVEAIHQNCDQLVTVGSASLKWNSTYEPPTEGNLWSDQALQAAWPSPDAYLDFYDIHFYDWMKDKRANFDPFSRPADFWYLEKPTLIGETTPFSDYYSPQEMMEKAYLNGFAGHLFWSYAANGHTRIWNNLASPLADFSQSRAPIDFRCEMIPVEENSYTFQPNPVQAGQPFLIDIETTDHWRFKIEIIDATGRVVQKSVYPLRAGQHHIKHSTILRARGVYFIRINDEPFRKILVY